MLKSDKDAYDFIVSRTKPWRETWILPVLDALINRGQKKMKQDFDVSITGSWGLYFILPLTKAGHREATERFHKEWRAKVAKIFPEVEE